MPKRVRADPHPRAAGGDVTADEAIDAPRRESATTIIHEQRIAGTEMVGRCTAAFPAASSSVPGHQRLSSLQVLAKDSGGAGIERDNSLLAAFPQDTHHFCAQVHIVHIQSRELAQTKAGR